MNHRIEQDHPSIKRIVKAMVDFKTFNSARRTIRGIESLNVIRKGQVKGIERGEVRTQVEFVSQIFGLIA